MPCDFLRQLFTVRAGCPQELLAEHDRHFEVDLVGVNAVFWLTDNDLAANAEFHRIGRWEIPASTPRFGACLAFFRNLQKDITAFLVLPGLRGGVRL